VLCAPGLSRRCQRSRAGPRSATATRASTRHCPKARSTRPGTRTPRQVAAHRLAGRLRRRRLHLGALRRRDLTRAWLLPLGLQVLRRPADRRRVELPVSLPVELRTELVDRTAGRRAHTAERRRHRRHHRPAITDDGNPPSRRSGPDVRPDAGYDPAGISHGLTDVRAQVLVRLRSDRVFFTYPVASPTLSPTRVPPARRDGHGATASASSSPTTGPPPYPTPTWPSKTPATARSASVPGTTCTRACTAGGAGPGRACHLSCAGASSGSTSSGSRSRARALTTSWCGSGTGGLASPTSNCA